MSDTHLPSSAVLRHCRQVTRQRARNFYYGLKLLPEPQRSAVYAMYAWMRRADDLVDNEQLNADQKRQQLVEFRSKTASAVAGQPPDDDLMWPGIAFVAKRFDIKSAHLNAMLDGQLRDLRERNFQTFDDLRKYCFQVASTVGLVCIEIWGYHDPSAPELAISRGIAFQLTNILRDFREDFDTGRLYMPRDDFERAGLSPQELRRWSKPAQCRDFIAMHVERAASYYDQSAALDGMITPQCRPTLWAMTTIYRNLLDKIRTDPAQIVSDKRLRLSAIQKAMIAVQARWMPPAVNKPVGAGT